MKFNVITIFPDLISHYANESILGRGQKAGAIKINPVNLRDFSEDKHKKVDDTPYGGGPGMVMKPEPIYRALESLGVLRKQGLLNKILGFAKEIISHKSSVISHKNSKKKVILLSPRGKQFDQKMAESFSKLDEITFICGRYEGVDQRVTDYMIDEEVSIGPYVLAGGELGALVMIEAVSRLVPGVLGNPESLEEETFNTLAPQHLSTSAHEKLTKDDSAQVFKCSSAQVDKEYPQYTKPADFKGWKVPEVLLSGDHKRIKDWRNSK